MLNNPKIERKTYGNIKSFIVDSPNSTALSCMVADTGVTANSEGKKIVKMGTPVKGDLKARNTALTVDASGSAPVGLIVHDVDVTSGTANSQVLVFGTVDISKVDSDVSTMIKAAESKFYRITVTSR